MNCQHGLKNKLLYNPHGWAFNMRDKLKKLIYVGIEKVVRHHFVQRLFVFQRLRKDQH